MLIRGELSRVQEVVGFREANFGDDVGRETSIGVDQLCRASIGLMLAKAQAELVHCLLDKGL